MSRQYHERDTYLFKEMTIGRRRYGRLRKIGGDGFALDGVRWRSARWHGYEVGSGERSTGEVCWPVCEAISSIL